MNLTHKIFIRKPLPTVLAGLLTVGSLGLAGTALSLPCSVLLLIHGIQAERISINHSLEQALQHMKSMDEVQEMRHLSQSTRRQSASVAVALMYTRMNQVVTELETRKYMGPRQHQTLTILFSALERGTTVYRTYRKGTLKEVTGELAFVLNRDLAIESTELFQRFKAIPVRPTDSSKLNPGNPNQVAALSEDMSDRAWSRLETYERDAKSRGDLDKPNARDFDSSRDPDPRGNNEPNY